MGSSTLRCPYTTSNSANKWAHRRVAAHTVAVVLVVYRHVLAVAVEFFGFHVTVLACPHSGKLVAVALTRMPTSGYFHVPLHARYFVYLQHAKLHLSGYDQVQHQAQRCLERII